MNYFSIEFIVFFVGVVSLYYLAPPKYRISLLLAASTLFYMAYVPKYIFILFSLITLDYSAGLLIERAKTKRAKKAWLSMSLISNLGLIAAFKYSFDLFGVSIGLIPLGLSFHTFQAMAYTIEVYRGRQVAERSFFTYALYILFFPQIAAGPIERPQQLIHQFKEVHPFHYARVVSGLQLMAWGFFQKYVIADMLSPMVDSVYRNYNSLPGPLILVAAVAFPFQILCDFAGYSDIATGAAEVLGFKLTRNFNRPFLADSMAEYWKRWHISFSFWMRDYVFFPVCGSRPRTARICGAIFIVFLLNGLWHGARWNYLVSGLLHGLYRVTEFLAGRYLSKTGWSLPAIWEWPLRIGRTVLVFSLMAFAFIFFRAESLNHALGLVSHLVSGWGSLSHPHAVLDQLLVTTSFSIARLPFLVCMIALLIGVHIAQEFGSVRARIAMQPAWMRWGIYYAAIGVLFVFGSRDGNAFIYFQF